MSDLNPVAIILVTSGTRGDRLLFRYPYEEEENPQSVQLQAPRPRHNPYAQKITEDRLSRGTQWSGQLTRNGVLVGFEDKTLANLLAVKTSLCGRKFTVKIDDIRFVGYPIQIEHGSYLSARNQLSQSNSTAKLHSHSHRINTVNVVFALRANIVDSAIDSYHALAKELIVAICHEEKRCHYLSTQSKIIRSVFDFCQSRPEGGGRSPFGLILQRSQLAKELKVVYSSLVDSGVVAVHVNHWVEVNFCLPHKIHLIVTGSRVLHLEPKEVASCLASMRPYHGLLLLQSMDELLSCLPMDTSPALVRVVRMISPVKNFQTLALDCDLSLSQVFLLGCHLVYWGKAMVIYPLCESNEYVLSPRANTLVNSHLVQEFVQHFPGRSLHLEMAEFSLPCQLGDKPRYFVEPQYHAQHIQMVVWMLQKKLLIQLHKYIYFVPSQLEPEPAAFRPTSASSEASFSNVQVQEESLFRYLMDDHSNLERAPSLSDVASVNSDESVGSAHPITASTLSSLVGKNLSKSPSLEAGSEGSTAGEEGKAQWQVLHNVGVLKDLTWNSRCAIAQCPAARSTEDLQLFARLFPYFNGRHHLEEIMFYENLRRSQLLTLLDKFKDVLIVATHE